MTICVTQRLNTPQTLTDKTGQIVWSAQYDEFGSAQIASTGGTSSTSSVVWNLRFPGQYFDAETGLHYNFHRYYDPALGRYITEDPIRDGLNWYAYAGSNPGNAIDPLGLDWWNPLHSNYILDFDAALRWWAGINLTPEEEQFLNSENAMRTFCNSPLRGFYISGGGGGILKSGKGKGRSLIPGIGWIGGLTGSWTMDSGASIEVEGGLGLRQRGYNIRGSSSQEMGLGVSGGWNEQNGYSGNFGIYGGGGNRHRNSGGSINWNGLSQGMPNNIRIGIGAKYFNSGVIIDIEKLMNLLRLKYWTGELKCPCD